jgi:putative ABC transport system substrate-binding protein
MRLWMFAAIALWGLCVAFAADAQAGRVYRVGVIFWRIPPGDLVGKAPRFPGARVLRESLAAHGWILDQNIELLWRSAEGDPSRLEAIVDELVRLPVDALAISGNNLIHVAMRKTRTIPIVMMVSTTPVEAGLIASLSHPGGNVTGLSGEPAADLNGKRLALLKQAAPQVTRVAFLHDTRTNSMSGGITPFTEAAARSLGITLLPYGVDSMPDLERAISDAIRQGANAVFVDTSLSAAEKDQPAFHRLAERHKLPAMHTYGNAVTTGGLMFYGTASGLYYRRAAFYIDRILRGAKPAEMPVEQPSTYELIVNLKAARAIGLAVPAAIRGQADKLIE